MSLSLYLTPAEQTLFDSLSDELKSGWDTHVAEIDYEETPDKRLARFRVMNVQDPALKEFQAKAYAAGSMDEISAFADTLNMDDVNNDDLSEILYAMGPELIGHLLELYLGKAESSEDLNGLAGFSTMRHLLFGPR